MKKEIIKKIKDVYAKLDDMFKNDIATIENEIAYNEALLAVANQFNNEIDKVMFTSRLSELNDLLDTPKYSIWKRLDRISASDTPYDAYEIVNDVYDGLKDIYANEIKAVENEINYLKERIELGKEYNKNVDNLKAKLVEVEKKSKTGINEILATLNEISEEISDLEDFEYVD